MARKMTEWPSKRGPITKIMPSDGCIGDTVPLAVGKWYDFHEFGWYMGNVGLFLFARYGVRPPAQAYCKVNILFMFQARVTRFHSPVTLSRPRSENWRKPMADLMMPNTGSGVCLRRA